MLFRSTNNNKGARKAPLLFIFCVRRNDEILRVGDFGTFYMGIHGAFHVGIIIQNLERGIDGCEREALTFNIWRGSSTAAEQTQNGNRTATLFLG